MVDEKVTASKNLTASPDKIHKDNSDAPNGIWVMTDLGFYEENKYDHVVIICNLELKRLFISYLYFKLNICIKYILYISNLNLV